MLKIFAILFVGTLANLFEIGRRYAGFFDKLDETMGTLANNLSILARYGQSFKDDFYVRNVSSTVLFWNAAEYQDKSSWSLF